VRKSIINGKTGTNMKAFGRNKGGPLKMSEVRAIVAYIFAWEQLKESPALPPLVVEMASRQAASSSAADLAPIRPLSVTHVAGDAARGATLYTLHCATCHGAAGGGRIGPALARPWAAVRPDLTVRAVLQQGVPGTLMVGWGEAAGGPLDDAQIDDLVAFVLQLGRSARLMQAATTTTASVVDGDATPWQGPLGLIALLAGCGVIGIVALSGRSDRAGRP
jgi:mono/diheme cytochrome c family protein